MCEHAKMHRIEWNRIKFYVCLIVWALCVLPYAVCKTVVDTVGQSQLDSKHSRLFSFVFLLFLLINFFFLPFPTIFTLTQSVIMLMFREEKSPEDEIKAWQFWHSRQHSVKQRILDAGKIDQEYIKLHLEIYSRRWKRRRREVHSTMCVCHGSLHDYPVSWNLWNLRANAAIDKTYIENYYYKCICKRSHSRWIVRLFTVRFYCLYLLGNSFISHHTLSLSAICDMQCDPWMQLN